MKKLLRLQNDHIGHLGSLMSTLLTIVMRWNLHRPARFAVLLSPRRDVHRIIRGMVRSLLHLLSILNLLFRALLLLFGAPPLVFRGHQPLFKTLTLLRLQLGTVFRSLLYLKSIEATSLISMRDYLKSSVKNAPFTMKIGTISRLRIVCAVGVANRQRTANLLCSQL